MKNKSIIFRDTIVKPLKEWEVEKGAHWNYYKFKILNTVLMVCINPKDQLVLYSAAEPGATAPAAIPAELIRQSLELLEELERPEPEPEDETDW